MCPIEESARLIVPEQQEPEVTLIADTATVFVNNYQGNFLYFMYAPHKQSVYFDCWDCDLKNDEAK